MRNNNRETSQWRHQNDGQWRRSAIFIVNFEHTSLIGVFTVNFQQVNGGWTGNHIYFVFSVKRKEKETFEFLQLPG